MHTPAVIFCSSRMVLCWCCLSYPTSALDVHTHPLYVHAHSKAILMQALSADTEFLVDHNVMDYSLLVGVCSDSQQIVVGVIG